MGSRKGTSLCCSSLVTLSANKFHPNPVSRFPPGDGVTEALPSGAMVGNKTALLILGVNELRASCSHQLRRFASRECERLAHAMSGQSSLYSAMPTKHLQVHSC